MFRPIVGMRPRADDVARGNAKRTGGDGGRSEDRVRLSCGARLRAHAGWRGQPMLIDAIDG